MNDVANLGFDFPPFPLSRDFGGGSSPFGSNIGIIPLVFFVAHFWDAVVRWV